MNKKSGIMSGVVQEDLELLPEDENYLHKQFYKYRVEDGIIEYVPPHEKYIWTLVLAGMSIEEIQEDLHYMEFVKLPDKYIEAVTAKMMSDDAAAPVIEYNKKIAHRKMPMLPENDLGVFIGYHYAEVICASHGIRPSHVPVLKTKRYIKRIRMIMCIHKVRQFLECASMCPLSMNDILKLWNEQYNKEVNDIRYGKMTGETLAVFYSYYWQYNFSKINQGEVTERDRVKYLAGTQGERGLIKPYYRPHILLSGKPEDEFFLYFGLANEVIRKKMNLEILGQLKLEVMRKMSQGREPLDMAIVDLMKYLDSSMAEDEKEIRDQTVKELKDQIDSIRKNLSKNIQPASTELENDKYVPGVNGPAEEDKDEPYRKTTSTEN